jgi:hypothetical protein
MPAQVGLITQWAVINQLASAASPPTLAKSARMGHPAPQVNLQWKGWVSPPSLHRQGQRDIKESSASCARVSIAQRRSRHDR